MDGARTVLLLIICIGAAKHKVITNCVVSKEDDTCPQRHEIFDTRTRNIYEYLDNWQDGGVKVKIHAHDRNMTVNKYVKTERSPTINQNDTWHMGKSVEKAVTKVAKGPQYVHDKTHHEQLLDKVVPLKTHVHHCIGNCGGDPEKLKSAILNAVDHYKNVHNNCDEGARCKRDMADFGKYNPSKEIITDPVAEQLLRQALTSTLVYKNPQDFCLAMDTYYVESFNNVLNVFHDKRISFHKQQYNLRTNLTICHWNENVDRPFTSSWNLEDATDLLIYYISNYQCVHVPQPYYLCAYYIPHMICSDPCVERLYNGETTCVER